MLPLAVCGAEQWFRRDGDDVSWILRLDVQHYHVDRIDMLSRRTRAQGEASDDGSAIVFEDSKTSAAPSIVDGKRFLKKTVGDVLYEWLAVEDQVSRSMGLANFFHKVQKPEGIEQKVNQPPQASPVSAPR